MGINQLIGHSFITLAGLGIGVFYIGVWRRRYSRRLMLRIERVVKTLVEASDCRKAT